MAANSERVPAYIRVQPPQLRVAPLRSWNLAADELFGYPREEAIGRKVDDLANAMSY